MATNEPLFRGQEILGPRKVEPPKVVRIGGRFVTESSIRSAAGISPTEDIRIAKVSDVKTREERIIIERTAAPEERIELTAAQQQAFELGAGPRTPKGARQFLAGRQAEISRAAQQKQEEIRRSVLISQAQQQLQKTRIPPPPPVNLQIFERDKVIRPSKDIERKGLRFTPLDLGLPKIEAVFNIQTGKTILSDTGLGGLLGIETGLKDFFETPEETILKKRIEKKVKGKDLAAAGLFVVAGGLSLTQKTTQAFASPLQTIGGTVDLLFDLVAQEQFIRETIRDPIGTIGSIFFIGKAIKSQPFKVRQIDIPKTDFSIKTFGLERKGRAQPLISLVDGQFKIFTPDISKQLLELPKGVDIKPGTALETKIFQKGLKLLPERLFVDVARGKKIIPTAQIILRKTERVKSRFIGEQLIETERLSPKGVDVVLKIAREEEAVVFGSLARQVQFPKGRGKLPGDIDIRLPKGATAESVEAITKKTIKRLKEAGETAKAGETPGTILVKRKGKFVKAAEFKTLEGLLEGEVVPEQVLGFPKVAKPITIKEQKFTPLAEELRGVTQGVVRIRKVGELIDVFPSPKRFPKDIISVIDAAETLKESRFIPSPRLTGAIKKFKGFFPEQFPIKAPTGKTLIADFRSPGISVGISPRVLPIPSPIPSISPAPSPISISPGLSISPAPSPISISPGLSISPKISISPIPSISPPSISPGLSISPPSISPGLSISPAPSPISISPSISPAPSPISISPSISPAPSISPKLIKKEREIKQKLFDVEVKQFKSKKFLRINKDPLPRNKALNRGADIIDHSVAASFKLTPSTKKVDKPILDDSIFWKSHMFRSPVTKSKLPQKTFIEKNKFRINTPSELRGITAKGLLALRKKRALMF